MKTITLEEAMAIIENPDHKEYEAVADAYENHVIASLPKIVKFLEVLDDDMAGYPRNSINHERFKLIRSMLEEIKEVKIP